MTAHTSCISHPPEQRLVIVREDYLKICDSNHCAAALLNFFEHGHNTKLAHRHDAEHANEVAERHGDRGTQDMTLLQWHTQPDLEAGLLHLYERSAIRKALDLLLQRGYISLHKNPNPRYHFDKTHYFLFHPETVQLQVFDISDESFSSHRREEKASSSQEKLSSSEDFLSSSPKTSPEISILELPPSLPSGESPPTKGRRALSHFVPEEFVVTPHMERWAHEKCPSVDLELQTAQFRNHEFDKPRSDWTRAWYSWMLKAPTFAQRNGHVPKTPKDRAAEYADLARQIQAEEAANGHQ